MRIHKTGPALLEMTEDGRCPYCGEKVEWGGRREDKKRRRMGLLSGSERGLSRLFLRYLIPGRRSRAKSDRDN